MVVVEYAPHGCLRDYLRKHRDNHGLAGNKQQHSPFEKVHYVSEMFGSVGKQTPKGVLTYAELINFAYQVRG